MSFQTLRLCGGLNAFLFVLCSEATIKCRLGNIQIMKTYLVVKIHTQVGFNKCCDVVLFIFIAALVLKQLVHYCWFYLKSVIFSEIKIENRKYQYLLDDEHILYILMPMLNELSSLQCRKSCCGGT